MTGSSRFLLAVVCVFALPGFCLPQTIVLDRHVGPHVERVMVVSPAEFTEGRIIAIARQFMKDRPETAHLLKLNIATTKKEALASRAGRSVPDYKYWRSFRQELSADPGPFAQLLAFNDDGAVRIQRGDGPVRTIVLGDSNPLEFTAGGVDFGLADLAAREVALRLPGIAPDGYVVEFYYTAKQKLNLKACEMLTNEVFRRAGIRDGYVFVANDAWFITDVDFPTFYRFGPVGSIPTYEEYLAKPKVRCSADEKERVHCIGHRLE